MPSKPEGPTEPFKRALAHATRSLAEQPDLEVVFGGDESVAAAAGPTDATAATAPLATVATSTRAAKVRRGRAWGRMGRTSTASAKLLSPSRGEAA